MNDLAIIRDVITGPALVICGTADRLTPPKYSEALRDRIPGARLELEVTPTYRNMGTALAREPRVTAALEGSVRRSGNRLRVAAQLVDTRDGYQIWSRTFEREVADVFAVQDEIAGAVAQALRVKLAPGRPITAAERRTAVPEAYEKYLLGRQLYYARGSSDGFRGAIGAFERSIAADPGYAPAWVGLATTAMLGLAMAWGVRRALSPVRQLSEEIASRGANPMLCTKPSNCGQVFERSANIVAICSSLPTSQSNTSDEPNSAANSVMRSLKRSPW